ncbi:hypothetical protein [Roseomonas indoligenes]|uniref:Hydratase n=1 Tax=Roseomonas indoligenes TaxID=2820811 RepID=A0A940MUP4_9PROT|nr:hypothetical protein [Pararoseomonas indoligenes]MBP0492321.1 hypothetical protein [Pararoseomonas indoligenes]
MNAIQAAGELLARARAGAALPGLPPALRPATLEAAEGIQHATLAAMDEGIGGWKIGRLDGIINSAPIPASRLLTDPLPGPITLPAERYIEMELAIQFRVAVAPADVATLVPGDLTGLATLATLFEFVRPRIPTSGDVTPLDRIADAMGNDGALVRATLLPWTLTTLDMPPALTLFQDDAVLTRREAVPHVAAPLGPLLEAWIGRLRREGRGIAMGEVVTLGSLSGMPPIPAAGATYFGEIEGMEALRCTVAPVS